MQVVLNKLGPVLLDQHIVDIMVIFQEAVVEVAVLLAEAVVLAVQAVAV
jgi:hypothetical protein